MISKTELEYKILGEDNFTDSRGVISNYKLKENFLLKMISVIIFYKLNYLALLLTTTNPSEVYLTWSSRTKV